MSNKNVIIEPVLKDGQLDEKTRLYARVTVLPGGEIAYHEHHNETETYYILSGEGVYNDNGKTYTVTSGMSTFCPDGGAHGISCNGNENLVFMALIL